jgi:dTDP-4-amino-4,6-dideoxygalactose transaminase
MIPLAKPFFDESEYNAVREVMDSRMVSQGDKVAEFEDRVRKYCGAKYAVAVSSCTAGLYLVLNSINRIEKTSIATTAFTFPAIQKIANYNEWTAINTDVERDTYNVSPDELEKLHERIELGVIIGTDLFGSPCNRNCIERIAKMDNNNTPVIYDSACAIGSTYNWKKVGEEGTCVFSFHGRKLITTGEGGMILTDDDRIYDAVLLGRQYGKNKKGNFVSRGMNFKMSDINAAVGCAQIEKIDKILEERKKIAHMYWRKIETPSIWTPNNTIPPNAQTNWQSYVIRMTTDVDRESVIRKMKNGGVECQIGSYDNSNGRCKNSAILAKTTIALPIWVGMTEEDVEYITEILNGAVK